MPKDRTSTAQQYRIYKKHKHLPKSFAPNANLHHKSSSSQNACSRTTCPFQLAISTSPHLNIYAGTTKDNDRCFKYPSSFPVPASSPLQDLLLPLTHLHTPDTASAGTACRRRRLGTRCRRCSARSACCRWAHTRHRSCNRCPRTAPPEHAVAAVETHNHAVAVGRWADCMARRQPHCGKEKGSVAVRKGSSEGRRSGSSTGSVSGCPDASASSPDSCLWSRPQRRDTWGSVCRSLGCCCGDRDAASHARLRPRALPRLRSCGWRPHPSWASRAAHLRCVLLRLLLCGSCRNARIAVWWSRSAVLRWNRACCKVVAVGILAEVLERVRSYFGDQSEERGSSQHST